jgi:hypothetical protein
MDATAPALSIAQAIASVGNYFNQELFGRPSDLPWPLEIDPDHRPERYLANATFHPTSSTSSCGTSCWPPAWCRLARHRAIRPPGLFALYVAGYCAFRIVEELLRVDPAAQVLGLRWNLLLAVVGLAWFAQDAALGGRLGTVRSTARYSVDRAAASSASATSVRCIYPHRRGSPLGREFAMRRVLTFAVTALLVLGGASVAKADHTHALILPNGNCAILAEQGNEKYMILPDVLFSNNPNVDADDAAGSLDGLPPNRRHPLHVLVHLGVPGADGDIVVMGSAADPCAATGNYVNG